MDTHVDIVRNDPDNGRQTQLMRVYIDPDVKGYAVKDEVDESIMGVLAPLADERGATIVVRLRKAFHGPYIVATELHKTSKCPFESRSQVKVSFQRVTNFVLPPPEADD